MERYARGYAEVDLDAIVSNMKNMKACVSDHTRMMGVVKTDGYGHGSVPVARALEKLDCMYGFAVATAEEALELRKNGITLPVLVLGHTFPYSYGQMVEQDISAALFREDTARLLAEEAGKRHKQARVHIKVDTGMGRIGIRPEGGRTGQGQRLRAAAPVLGFLREGGEGRDPGICQTLFQQRRDPGNAHGQHGRGQGRHQSVRAGAVRGSRRE